MGSRHNRLKTKTKLPKNHKIKNKIKREKKDNKSPILLTFPLPGDKEKKKTKNLLFNIFYGIGYRSIYYNQQMKKKCVIMKAANFAMIDSQYFCMFNKSEREMKF